jgi:hypothetical protein
MLLCFKNTKQVYVAIGLQVKNLIIFKIKGNILKTNLILK